MFSLFWGVSLWVSPAPEALISALYWGTFMGVEIPCFPYLSPSNHLFRKTTWKGISVPCGLDLQSPPQYGALLHAARFSFLTLEAQCPPDRDPARVLQL